MPRNPHATWSRPSQAAAIFLRGYTIRASSPIALVVGTILSAVNQGAVIAGGQADTSTWLRVAFNYAVPFVVASLGYLSAHRSNVDEHTDRAVNLGTGGGTGDVGQEQ
ncbi:nitrate/nitrite transporter NrtS [Mycobacterium riyadhense]|uniref:nitrate/nitrite transporter NrtS n=1 Tax=Mycobacterium riyadhense TaxID=486698 RepID=UPI00146FB7B1|nr:nitrate/nitrite transporter NrtS [Mycobacterium riyadhense]MCV7146755.1 nitrate/nitrite transporter NrtS [Mycobacterium riyadhense]